MSRFSVSVPAERDINEIAIYLAENADPATARRVLADLRKAMRFLARNPRAGHLREDLTSRPYRFWTVYSYFIVYDPSTSPIEVVRVLHAARDVRSAL
jgi:antitoxin ParD1/3/4/toxin ParE1/3/4